MGSRLKSEWKTVEIQKKYTLKEIVFSKEMIQLLKIMIGCSIAYVAATIYFGFQELKNKFSR